MAYTPQNFEDGKVLKAEELNHIEAGIAEIEKNLKEKQPAGNYIETETDPTVPSWAKQPTKPTYTANEVGARPATWMPSASEVGADPSGTAETKVSEHNTNEESHGDIRLLISGLTTRLNALANSDDTTLDQMAEVVAYIKSNRTLIESVTTGKVNVTDIINNLTTNVANKPLSAAQGVALKGLIDALQTALNNHIADGTAHITAAERTAWNNKQPAGNYATKEELPTKTSQLTDDVGFAKQSDLEKQAEEIGDLKNANYVKTVNGMAPDENGNVVVSGGTGTCPYEEVNSIEEMTDTTKKYVMNGYVYSYVATSGVEVPDFTNLAKITDTDTRLNSSGSTTALAGHAVTDWVNCVQGDVIRVKGLNILHKDSGYVQLYTNVASSSASKPSSYTAHFTTDSDGVISFTVATWISTTTQPTITKMRFSGEVTGSVDDIIITKNEEIAYRVTDGTYEWIKGEKCDSSSGSTGGTTTEEETIPTWWEDEVADTVAKIRALQVGANTITFPFFSDNHQRNGYAGVLIKKVMDECNIPYCLYGGDSISSAGNMTEEIMIEQDRKFDSMMKIIPNGRFCRAVGNHDGYWLDSSGVKHWYSRSQIYDLFLREESIAQNKHFGMDGTYYYIDEIASKTRFIILNTEGTNGAGAVDAVQLEWLKNVALKFDEAEWSVVIISHRPISNHYHAQISNAQEVVNTVKDYINGNDENKADIAGWFSAHIHRDRIYTGMAINTSDDTVGEELPFTQVTIISDHTAIGYGGVSHPIDDSDQSHAIDFITINKDTREVNITRLGFGEDRSFTYTQSPLPNTLIPPTTVDFSEEQWVEESGYMQESTFMFDPSKSYKVIWDGVEYVVDVMDMSDDTATIYAAGNLAVFELEDNGLPFAVLTMNDADIGMVYGAINWAYMSGQTEESTSTFSVAEIIEEDLPVYKCTLEEVTIDGETGTVLKGISFREITRKQRNIELDGKLYTTNFTVDSNNTIVYLARIYPSDMVYLSKETLIFQCVATDPSDLSTVIMAYANTTTGKISMTNITSETD